MKKKMLPAKTKRTLLILFTIVLAVILTLLVVGVAYMESLLNLINKNPDNSTISAEEYQDYLNSQKESMDSDFTGEVIHPGDVDWEINTDEVKNEDHITNIMLVGQDRRPGEGRQRSDVMILCTINTATKELTLTSFMRDMYVPNPGYYDDKMNACYTFGGMNLLSKCLASNFGVYVDGMLEVDFDGFTDVIDAMGGVDMYLTQSEANYLINCGVAAKEGMNHLDGYAALFYTRNRSVGNGDFTRTARQRKVISALVEKCRGMSLTQLKKLVEKVLPMITTDLTNKEILDYTADLLPLLTDLKVNTQRIPADGTFKDAWIREMAVLVPDLAANRELLKATMAK